MVYINHWYKWRDSSAKECREAFFFRRGTDLYPRWREIIPSTELSAVLDLLPDVYNDCDVKMYELEDEIFGSMEFTHVPTPE